MNSDQSSNPILVEIYRENVLESFHRGVICIVNKNGKIIYSEGDVNQLCYPRSAMKFFQHFPLIECGAFDHFNFTLEELAIMCGSHNGEKEHIRVVDSILTKIGLDRSYLHCGAQMPTLKKDVAELIVKGEKPQTIHNNCSGKHAGFLAMCVYMNEDPKTYWKADHPLQKLIKKTVAEMHDYDESKMITALDGCSAPIFSIPVYNQALAYKHLVNFNQYGDLRKRACRLVIEAVKKYPMMVAGTQRYCTDMINICGSRIIGKTGAEGIYCLSFIEEGAAACIKIDDGKMLPQYNIAQKIIEQTNIFDTETLKPLEHYIESELKNFNQYVTGKIKVSDSILAEKIDLLKFT